MSRKRICVCMFSHQSEDQLGSTALKPIATIQYSLTPSRREYLRSPPDVRAVAAWARWSETEQFAIAFSAWPNESALLFIAQSAITQQPYFHCVPAIRTATKVKWKLTINSGLNPGSYSQQVRTLAMSYPGASIYNVHYVIYTILCMVHRVRTIFLNIQS